MQKMTFDDENAEDEEEAKISNCLLVFVVGFVVKDCESDVDDGKDEEAVVKVEYFFEIEASLSALFDGLVNEFVGGVFGRSFEVVDFERLALNDEGFLGLVL
jgi:hypothetical protein